LSASLQSLLFSFRLLPFFSSLAPTVQFPFTLDLFVFRHSTLHKLKKAEVTSRPLKNAHLRRSAHSSSLRRTAMYASFLGISEALDLDVFEQPVSSDFFSNLLDRIQSVRLNY
jgi:hypothetical protein